MSGWWGWASRIAPREPRNRDLPASEVESEPECQPQDDEPESAWVPGDPLWSRHQAPHSQYLFNFCDDPSGENCTCADAADWPGQKRRPLPDRDELGDFIAAYHAETIDGERSA